MNKSAPFIKNFITFCLFFFLFTYLDAEILSSWNDGSAKNAIIKFVEEVTTEGNKSFIPKEERIATFDEDGTLWIEQPMYVQLFFALDQIKLLAPQHPEWRDKEPFKSILSGNKDALNHLDLKDIEQTLAVTHSGMSVEVFHQEVSNWLEKAVHPKFQKPFTELVYQPMLEVIQYLRDNQFDIYIVSGGGQEFIRAFAEKVYNIPPSHVIGTANKVKYEYQNGRPVLLKIPELLFINDKAGKPEGINLVIGKRPIAAFGNSIGDQQMLEWTQGNKRKNLELLVHHDDADREYAYGPESKIGTFSDALMNEAKKQEWIVVSMKKDWKVIFSWQLKK